MKEIKLSRGMVALVDDEDFDFLNSKRWYALKSDRTFYAFRRFGKKKNSMHRYLLNVIDPKIFVDHKDHNGLNNQKNNLRLCTHNQNCGNSRSSKSSSSKYRGVYFARANNNWGAVIQKDGKPKYLGVFDTERDAAIAYNIAATLIYKEFACLNNVTNEEIKRNIKGKKKEIFKIAIVVLVLIFLSSCSICPPASQVTNGRAAQKHDLKKFRATYRKEGNFYIVRYENKLELRKEIVLCKPPFKSGSWITP